MRVAGVAVLLASIVVATANAAAPANYRARVNAICRSYTPTLKKYDSQMAKAQGAKNTQAFYAALGRLVTLTLEQDVRVEAVPVPAVLKPAMTPILARLKTIDAHFRRSLAAARAGDPGSELSEIFTIAEISKPLNKQFDAAGLKDCGSNQT